MQGTVVNRRRLTAAVALALVAGMAVGIGLLRHVGPRQEAAAPPGSKIEVGPAEVESWAEGWESPAATTPGEPAPDFALLDREGRMVRLSDYRGRKAVFVNFWATWCAPCRIEMPEMQEIYAERGQEVEILAVNVEESGEQVRRFMASLGLTFPALLDSTGAVANRYQVWALPTSVFIDRQGIVRARYAGLMSRETMEASIALALDPDA